MPTREQQYNEFQAYEAFVRREALRQEFTTDVGAFALSVVSAGTIAERPMPSTLHEQAPVAELAPVETRRSYGAPAVGNVIQFQAVRATERAYMGYGYEAQAVA